MNDNPKNSDLPEISKIKQILKCGRITRRIKLPLKTTILIQNRKKKLGFAKAKKPSLVILQDDKTIKFENANLYKYLSSVKSGISTEIPIGNDKKFLIFLISKLVLKNGEQFKFIKIV